MTTPAITPAPPPTSSSVITRTSDGEYFAPWLVYCDKMPTFGRQPQTGEWIIITIISVVLLSLTIGVGIRNGWDDGVIFFAIFAALAGYVAIRVGGDRSSARQAFDDAKMLPATNCRLCATQCVVFATVPRRGGNLGTWFIDPPMWRELCGRLLEEGRLTPTVVSVDIDIPTDLLAVGDIYEETDVGAARRLTPGAARSLKRNLALALLCLFAVVLALRYTAFPPGTLGYPLGLSIGYVLLALLRLSSIGNGVTSAIASPRKLSVLHFGKETVFTPTDSVLLVQKSGGKSRVRAYKERYDGAGEKVTIRACRDDGKTAELIFDDRRDAGLADLLARWNAPARADELPGQLSSQPPHAQVRV